ncbi:tripartite tricarboxylate transporter substrate binding protein [Bordetella sp. BOR01]|uniref:Bug family tripartite tricarboxylate transporter substrate binding protein n=1 Tax=Bordetella sp. BOR01 TaxID=2854779 RepID=UPI001C4924DF|nr:tripartite tricarboxylate transporter substrate binding protein [Bordetella sp. BOR01]MBV7484052.1 tripartite tricarboxylate transporter substrate binding protein [Bordetella sp. BOR01]
MPIQVCRIAAALAASLVAAATWAAFPDKPVHIVVPYGPGGGVDTFTRPLAAEMGTLSGQTFVIENKAGGGGTIGTRHVVQAPADGYTVLSGGVHQAIAEGVYPSRGFQLARQLTPLVMTAIVPNVLVVNAQSRFKDVPALIAYARANPEQLNYCSSGVGTAQHLVAEMFMEATQTRMTHIPYTGTAAALADLLGGHCDLMFDGLGTSAQFLRSGKLRGLAFTTKTPSPYFPDIPAMKAAGGPDMEASIWYGFWVSADTPPDRKAALQQLAMRALQTDAVRKAFETQGATLSSLPAAQLDGFVDAEIARWQKIVQATGATAK